MKNTMKLVFLIMILFPGYLLAGGVDGVDPAKSSKLVANPSQPVVKLFYQGEKKGKVTIRIFDAENVLVHTDKIYNKNGFVRPYNFKELVAGKYRFEITDCEGMAEKVLEYKLQAPTENKIIRARLNPVEKNENKLKLDVLGVINEAVFVRIFNDNKNEIFSETIDIQQSFSRVYNLENLRDRRVSFEVSTEEKLLLKQ